MKKVLMILASTLIGCQRVVNHEVQGPKGDSGSVGMVGPSGTAGAVGPAGRDGTSCTVIQLDNGAQVLCADGSVANIYNGKNGSSGRDGKDCILDERTTDDQGQNKDHGKHKGKKD